MRKMIIRSVSIIGILLVLLTALIAFLRFYPYTYNFPAYPKITHTQSGANGDPLNILFVGSRDQITRSFHQAGWLIPDPITPQTSAKIAIDSLAHRSYPIYILAQLLAAFLTGAHALTSGGGFAWMAATFLAMLLLAFGKRVTGRQLQNEVLLTEGRVTLVDAYLAGAVLGGLLLNALFGWWWTDSLASLVIVYYGIREAIHALYESAKHSSALKEDR